jgi:hypothetical protein
MNDAIKTVGRKVAAIFTELAGDRARRLDGSVIAEPAMSTISSALTEQYGNRAADIAFHMADWNDDAAFVVAVHLFPRALYTRGDCCGCRFVLGPRTQPHPCRVRAHRTIRLGELSRRQ